MNETQAPMDQAAAYRYAAAWAKRINADPRTLIAVENGDFYGTLGSIAFEYVNAQNMLIVRAVVDPFASSLLKREDILKELHRIEQSDPKAVGCAKFDLLLGRWQTRQEPSLYLRLDVSDQSLSVDRFVSRLNELSDTAFLWNRTTFNKVAARVNESSKK